VRIVARRPVAGGDLNDAYHVELADGGVAFLKTGGGSDYAAEAAGLRWLAEADALPVPGVLAVEPHGLLLEWVEPGRLDARGEEELGRGLAALHRSGAPRFGWVPWDADELQLGPLRLPATPYEQWAPFYAECRLAPLLPRAGLSPSGRRAVERVCERMRELAGPPEPPARLHGDLWSGNVHADREGAPWLIDPAAHGGHREVDLAMLSLFGGPSRRFRDAYAEAFPLAEGHEERVELWQLFPLLVHAVLFGGGYAGAVERAAARYA
jgi:fructosamine-3-kinase